MPTNWLQEVVKRSERGPFMKEKDFEMKLARRTAELVREFGLRMAPDVLVPADDDMADRLYQAGMQLVLDTGFYNMSTERCIMFTRDELEDIVAAAPASLTLGEGKDASSCATVRWKAPCPAASTAGRPGHPPQSDTTP
jgi:methylamine--corrinoid protein Co-methyltransferase